MNIPSEDFHYSGPASPRVVFVMSDENTPTLEEMIRAQPLVNENAVLFAKRYLIPLGLKREEVGVAWCGVLPEHMDKMHETIAKLTPQAVVYMGNVRGAGGSRPIVNLPRFAREGDVWKSSFKEEIDRKLKALRKNLDAMPAHKRPSLRPIRKTAESQLGDGIDAKVARIHKASKPKRIVYGVVLDPYQVDLQDDWIPPADIEETAHSFVAKHGYISYQHEGMADAKLVESSVEQYPSQEDYRKAMEGLPHRAYRRKFGKDVVHSGAWVMAVQLSPELWAEYERGELDAFSIEGFGTRSQTTEAAMPQVTFVDLETVR